MSGEGLTSDAIVLRNHGPDAVSRIIPTMMSAFPPEYGEAWTAEQCRSILATPGSHLLIATFSHQVVGFAISRRAVDEEEIMLLAVDPKFRRKKVATKIIDYIKVLSKENGVINLFIEVRENNLARLFYEKIGFFQIGLRKEYYKGSNGERYNAITYRLPI